MSICPSLTSSEKHEARRSRPRSVPCRQRVCVARVGRYDFEDRPAPETLQSLYARVFFTPLSGIKGLPNITSHGGWKGPEIPSGRSYPPDKLQLAFHLYHYTFMCMSCQPVLMTAPYFVGRGAYEPTFPPSCTAPHS